MADGRRRALAQRLTDFLFPPLCIVCDSPRAVCDRWLCETCKNALRVNHERRNPCPRCGMNRRLGHCACVHGWQQPFDNVYSVLDFDNLVQAVLHQVKYRGKRRLASYLGTLLGGYVPDGYFEGIDALIAVPLHKSHQKKRGYNQSLWLARGLGERCPTVPLLDDALSRVRNTPSQTKLDKTQREKNMKGAFAVAPGKAEKVRGKRLLLVDDIVTTGATTAAATHALLHAGAASVRVFSVARD